MITNREIKIGFIAIIIVMLIALIPHSPGFTPLGALAIMVGGMSRKKSYFIIVGLLALYCADFILNNTIMRVFFTNQTGIVWYSSYMIWTYGAYLMIILASNRWLKKVTAKRVGGAAIGASLIFFFMSNFGSWLFFEFYPKTMTGLVFALEAGLPFFWNTLISNLLYAYLLFGAYYLAREFYIMPATDSRNK